MMIKKMKMWVPGIFMALVLTACGTPDAVADELKKVSASAGFTGSSEDAEAFAMAVDKGEMYSEQEVVSEQMGKRIDTLAEFLEQKLEEEKIHPLREYDEYAYYDYVDNYDGELSDVQKAVNTVNTDDVLESLKNWRLYREENTFLGDCAAIAASFEMTPEAADTILKGLAEIGFEGLSLPDNGEYYCHVITNGVGFTIQYMEETERYYIVDVEVLTCSLVYPEKYEELLKDHMRDAFMPDRILCGGYLEYIQFSGSQANPFNGYNKQVEIFFREGKPIQTNLSIVSNSGKKGDEFLTEAEKKDLSGLLTWLSGDAKASEEFLAELGKTSNKKGSIGRLNWYQLSSLGSGGYVVRFQ